MIPPDQIPAVARHPATMRPRRNRPARPEPRIVADSQPQYQELMEKRIEALVRQPPSSPDELLELVTHEIGARAYTIARSRPSAPLEFEKRSRARGISWKGVQRDLETPLRRRNGRSLLVAAGEPFDSVNHLVCRFSGEPDHADWHRALVLVDRVCPPFRGAPTLFLTRDLPLVELVTDRYMRCLDPSVAPVWQEDFLRYKLAQHLGPQVELTAREGELVVSGITSWDDLGAYTYEGLAETCVFALFGGWVGEQTYLEKARSTSSEVCLIEHLLINVYGYRVYERRISVRRFRHTHAAQVIVPQGWWWVVRPAHVRITANKALETAHHSERRKQPKASDLKAHCEETVLWPENPAGRVAHIVQMSSEMALCPTYVIDASDGRIITRRQRDRTEPAVGST